MGMDPNKRGNPPFEPSSYAAGLRGEVEALRLAMHEIDIEAGNTIPPDGKEAAFAALDRITAIINPFRLPRTALGDTQ